MKSDGDPATPADFRRYVLTIVVGPLLWGIANVIGNHLWRDRSSHTDSRLVLRVASIAYLLAR